MTTTVITTSIYIVLDSGSTSFLADPPLFASVYQLETVANMAEKDQITYNVGPDTERSRSSIADVDINKNLDAK